MSKHLGLPAGSRVVSNLRNLWIGFAVLSSGRLRLELHPRLCRYPRRKRQHSTPEKELPPQHRSVYRGFEAAHERGWRLYAASPL